MEITHIAIISEASTHLSANAAKAMIAKASEGKLLPRYASMQSGECFSNVKQLVNEQGGEIVYGWQVCIHKNLLLGVAIDIQTHAVWMKPDGELVEVTAEDAKFSTFNDGETHTFIQDNSYAYKDIGISISALLSRQAAELCTKAWEMQGRTVRILPYP